MVETTWLLLMFFLGALRFGNPSIHSTVRTTSMEIKKDESVSVVFHLRLFFDLDSKDLARSK